MIRQIKIIYILISILTIGAVVNSINVYTLFKRLESVEYKPSDLEFLDVKARIKKLEDIVLHPPIGTIEAMLCNNNSLCDGFLTTLSFRKIDVQDTHAGQVKIRRKWFTPHYYDDDYKHNDRFFPVNKAYYIFQESEINVP